MVKEIDRICRNCKLYDPKTSECQVIIIVGSQKVKLPVDPNDPCFFEQSCFDPKTGTLDTLNEIQEVKLWVEDETGEKTNKDGSVKIEYPEGFFGKRLSE